MMNDNLSNTTTTTTTTAASYGPQGETPLVISDEDEWMNNLTALVDGEEEEEEEVPSVVLQDTTTTTSNKMNETAGSSTTSFTLSSPTAVVPIHHHSSTGDSQVQPSPSYALIGHTNNCNQQTGDYNTIGTTTTYYPGVTYSSPYQHQYQHQSTVTLLPTSFHQHQHQQPSSPSSSYHHQYVVQYAQHPTTSASPYNTSSAQLIDRSVSPLSFTSTSAGTTRGNNTIPGCSLEVFKKQNQQPVATASSNFKRVVSTTGNSPNKNSIGDSSGLQVGSRDIACMATSRINDEFSNNQIPLMNSTSPSSRSMITSRVGIPKMLPVPNPLASNKHSTNNIIVPLTVSSSVVVTKTNIKTENNKLDENITKEMTPAFKKAKVELLPANEQSQDIKKAIAKIEEKKKGKHSTQFKRERNRRHAKLSRERKRERIAGMEDRIDILAKENKRLKGLLEQYLGKEKVMDILMSMDDETTNDAIKDSSSTTTTNQRMYTRPLEDETITSESTPVLLESESTDEASTNTIDQTRSTKTLTSPAA